MSEKEKQSDDPKFCNTTQMKVQIQKLESELAQAKEEIEKWKSITNGFASGLIASAQDGADLDTQNTNLKEALKVLRDVVDSAAGFPEYDDCKAVNNIIDDLNNKTRADLIKIIISDMKIARNALKKCDKILGG